MPDRFHSTERRRCPREHCGREVLINKDGSLRAHRKPMGTKGYLGEMCRDPHTGKAHTKPGKPFKSILGEMWERGQKEHAQEVADGKHDQRCEFRDNSMLCHCAKRRREAAGFTKVDDLIWNAPDCPHCDGEAEHDGDGWQCPTCDIAWDNDGQHGEFTDDYGDLSQEANQ